MNPRAHLMNAFGVADSPSGLTDEGPMPELSGAVGWLNSAPLTREMLRGNVVLVDIWTYSCINSLRQLPYLKSWAAKYHDAGLVVIGVHAPEFGFEKIRTNVEAAVRELKLQYPVALDTEHGIWRAFNNQYWPADYFIDGKGRIRHHHFGEGDYADAERLIQTLLRENGNAGIPGEVAIVSGEGIEAPPNFSAERSPETYVGYARAEHFASPEEVNRDARGAYSTPAKLTLNQWALSGSWNVGSESAVPLTPSGKIQFRFHSRDLHLVLGPTKEGKLARFRVRLDETAPAHDSGGDVAPDGTGSILEPRLYQLIRQSGEVRERTFEIEFLDPGAHAFVFTFG
ncbi:MAG: redoxin domain-containing protein [Gemmatimonadota bacterium]